MLSKTKTGTTVPSEPLRKSSVEPVLPKEFPAEIIKGIFYSCMRLYCRPWEVSALLGKTANAKHSSSWVMCPIRAEIGRRRKSVGICLEMAGMRNNCFCNFAACSTGRIVASKTNKKSLVSQTFHALLS